MFKAAQPRIPSLFDLLTYIIYFFRAVSAATVPSVSGIEHVRRYTTVPAPIVVAASQDFDGSDGAWSSFTLQVGSPPQNVKVFPSTSGYQTIVVLPLGCDSSDPTNCSDLRGRLFDPTQSTTWIKNTADVTTQIYTNNVGKSVGFTSKGSFGFDDVALGWEGAGGPTLRNQTIGGIASKDTYLGQFGLSPRASNFTNFTNPIPSYMENLKAQNMIPSKSWAYTAGNQYRNNKVLGSLVLGGYDESQIVPNNITWQMDAIDIRDLTIQIKNIETTTNSGDISLLNATIPAFLDSSVSWLYLPTDVCKRFEDAFDLRWHDEGSFYFLTDAQHTALAALNPDITFSIGNLTLGTNAKITLPYSAFDLTIRNPYVPNPTRYFPLKRINNTEQAVLGRVFFQEAYVVADYERGTFTVSQRDWTPNPKTNIVAIRSIEDSTMNTVLVPNNQKTSKLKYVGAIAGGAAGGVTLAIALIFTIWYFRFRKHKIKADSTEGVEAGETRSAMESASGSDQAGDTANGALEIGSTEKVELSGQDVYKAELCGIEGEHPAEYVQQTPAWPLIIQTDTKGRSWTAVEADGRHVEIHEMPAVEEVASELSSPLDRPYSERVAGLSTPRMQSEEVSPVSPDSPMSYVATPPQYTRQLR